MSDVKRIAPSIKVTREMLGMSQPQNVVDAPHRFPRRETCAHPDCGQPGDFMILPTVDPEKLDLQSIDFRQGKIPLAYYICRGHREFRR